MDEERRYGRLRPYNFGAGVFHLVQGIAIVALANDFKLPVTASFLTGPPGTPPGAPEVLFEVPLGLAVAAFIFMSALAHFIIVSPGVFPWYVKNLKRTRNYARWIEYAFSSSLMIVLIGMLPGVYDVAAIIAVFGANASMLLFGLLMEHYEEPGKPNWMPFIFGCLTGIVPWLALGVYLWSPGSVAEPPGFVYVIFATMFLFFNSFAINMVLQYKKIGPWRDYVFGERVYVFLSLSAKSLLAWLVFANTLIPS
jgi:hypothetical protein